MKAESIHQQSDPRRSLRKGLNHVFVYLVLVMLAEEGPSQGESLGSWQEIPVGGVSTWGDIAYASGLWVAVGGSGNIGGIWTSTDGQIWSRQAATLTPSPLTKVLHGDGLWVTVGNGAPITSPDGITWTIGNAPENFYTISLVRGKWLGTHSDGFSTRSYGSSDLQVWTPLSYGAFGEIAFGNGTWVSPGRGNGWIYISSDGEVWRPVQSGLGVAYSDTVFANGLWIIVGQAGSILTSVDAENWKLQPAGFAQHLTKIAFENQMWVACGDANTILTSLDGVNWRNNPLPGPYGDVSGIAFGSGKWFAVTRAGRMFMAERLFLPAIIGGVVLDADNRTPLKNAVLQLAKENAPPTVISTTGSGRYEFVDVQPGAYKLHASMQSYEAAEKSPILISENDRVEVNFELGHPRPRNAPLILKPDLVTASQPRFGVSFPADQDSIYLLETKTGLRDPYWRLRQWFQAGESLTASLFGYATDTKQAFARLRSFALESKSEKLADFGFLEFPLEGRSPYDTRVTAVLDHDFRENGSVLAYNGEVGAGESTTKKGILGYKKKDVDEDFRLRLLKYYDGVSNSERSYLFYDNHKGYDYAPDGIENNAKILAAAPGILAIATSQTKPDKANVWRDNEKCPVVDGDDTLSWEDFHTFYILHNNGYTTWYLHAKELEEKVLKSVLELGYYEVKQAGEPLATVGGKGAGSVHLHFGVRKNGKLVDPYGDGSSAVKVLWKILPP